MKEHAITFPLTNKSFLYVLSNAFYRFLEKGTSRSTDKLKPLHGAIAEDLHKRLGCGFDVFSQGYLHDKEALMDGRYIDKRVDITIKKNDMAVAGISVKFIMQNYSQNSNNYFENMLGETANIRANNRDYFQVFIILDKIPYYDNKRRIAKWETFTSHNIKKYVALSNDNINSSLHTPNKTLIYVVHIPDNDGLDTWETYLNYYRNLDFRLKLSEYKYDEMGSTVIMNDYETFIGKVFYTIMAK